MRVGGYYTYSATAQNSSDYSFSNVSLILALYDEDGVMAQKHMQQNSLGPLAKR